MSTLQHEILIVDDDQNNRFLLGSLLEQNGYKTKKAENGENALEVLKTFRPSLICLDIKMPIMDGHETARAIKKIKAISDIPILFISSMNDSKNITECFDDGAVDFISKPFRKPEVLARVRTHLELKELRNKAEKQAKEMEHFAYMAAHDLKAPAQVISSLSRQLQEGGGLDVEELAYRISKSSKKLSSLIDSLLQLADGSKKSFLRKDVDIDEVMVELKAEFLDALEAKGAELRHDVEGYIFSDLTAIKILLKNLISNSIKYAREGEPLVIQITLTDLDNFHRLVIKDNGSGFKLEEGKDPFSPFVRYHGMHIEGHGLGLSICKRIVDCHKGQIKIESDVGQGTTVTIDFPNKL